MTVSAERTTDYNDGERLLLDEIRDLNYKRSFIIPNKYETDKIDANFKNGMLTVSIPKKETLKPKTIDIR
jgi:HSP20 family molecular chaperone IbpA